METNRNLHNPIITYACELWDPNKEEKGTINRILDNIIKRVLMVPTSTPRENVYIETGIKDMTHNMTHRRINMLCRLETTKQYYDNIHTRKKIKINMEKFHHKNNSGNGNQPKHNHKKENTTTKRNTPSPR